MLRLFRTWRRLAWSAGVVVVLVTSASAAALLLPGRPSDSHIARLKGEGNQIVQEIEQYKVRSGQYPAELDGAGIPLPSALHGGWRYHAVAHGQAFVLSIGEYGEHLFELSWTSRTGEWMLDH